MSQSIKNKTIFISGATAGFGRACAEKFIKAGAKVIATGRREDRLQELQKELGSNLHTLTFDVRDNDAALKAIKSLPKPFSEIDILVNNAGGALGLSPFEKTSLAHAEQMVEANIMGVVYLTHAILPQMIARNSGHIINISSIAASYAYPGGNVYGATKAFVTQFSLNLRADLLGKNIRVTSVEPGLAETEFSIVRFDGDKEKADSVYKGTQPLVAEDIAESVFWCATQPAHVNVNRIEIMPTCQAFSPFAIHREKN